jgi:hypothetical protein
VDVRLSAVKALTSLAQAHSDLNTGLLLLAASPVGDSAADTALARLLSHHGLGLVNPAVVPRHVLDAAVKGRGLYMPVHDNKIYTLAIGRAAGGE